MGRGRGMGEAGGEKVSFVRGGEGVEEEEGVFRGGVDGAGGEGGDEVGG